MESALVEKPTFVEKPISKVPPRLAFLFNDPLLVGDEKREDYENLLSAIMDAIKPRDDIGWLFVGEVANLWWEIRREQKLKGEIIKLAKLKWICKLLSPARPTFLEMPHLPVTTDKLAELWSAAAETMQGIYEQLEKRIQDIVCYDSGADAGRPSDRSN